MHRLLRHIWPLAVFTGLGCILLPGAGCRNADRTTEESMEKITAAKGTYAYDAQFLKQHTRRVIELYDSSGQARVLLSADYQGRVMTSTAAGDSGASYGWLNYDLIASGKKNQQFNPVGGEERFWLGPEGGQYSLYFKNGDSFSIAHWQVPPVIDTIPFDVIEADASKAVFTKNASLTNYSGTIFNIAIQRTIRLLNPQTLGDRLGVGIPAGLQTVAYESVNQVRNMGDRDWKKESGLLSVWLLGMMTPTDQTTVIIPFRNISDARNHITDNYFGAMPAGRLTVKDSVLFFSCDGKHRSKIGLSPLIAKPIAGSFDFNRNILTVILFSVDRDGLYVNSKWEMQQEPYKGDVVNSYNDGPLADGSQLGPFYELESSSPALSLKRGEIGLYRQTTCHFEGDYASLSLLAKQLLGVELDAVKR